MKEEDMLLVEQLKAQNEAMIAVLKKNNDEIVKCVYHIKHFLNTDRKDLQGKAYDGVRLQMEDNLYIIQMLKFVNDHHINEYKRLNELVGSENLIGSVIVTYLKELKAQHDSLIQQQHHIRALMKLPFYKSESTQKFFENQLDNIAESLTYNQKEQTRWKAKEDKFDQIEASTREMFKGIASHRRMIQNAMNVIRVQFEGGHYRYLFNGEMKSTIETAIVDDLGTGKLELKSPIVTVIDRDGKRYYGGDQAFLHDYSGPNNNLVVKGCTFIALMNMQYFMEGTKTITVREYKNRLWRYINVNGEIFKSIVGYVETIPPIGSDNNNDITSYLDAIVKEFGYKGATWSKLDLDVIKDQLEHDIPVIVSTGDNKGKKDVRIPCFRKVGEYEYKEIEYARADKYTARRLLIDVGTKIGDISLNQHTFIVTGIDQRINKETGEVDTMLKLSTWGREWYCAYDDIAKYREGVLAGESQEIIDEYNKYGLGGISKVLYE